MVGRRSAVGCVRPRADRQVPGPWQWTDIGDVGTPGSVSWPPNDARGPLLVSGAGSDIWGTADSFHAVTRGFDGDNVVAARVVSEQNTSEFAKAGLTMGDTSSSGQRVILDVKPDVWLRLTRSGDQFIGETSSDGRSWTVVGSVVVANYATL